MAARIAVVLIDDGIEFDKMHDIEWHRNFAPVVGRILRIEHLAEKILDEGRPDGSTWTLDTFTETFIGKLNFGDKDLDLRLSNPLHLRTLLEDKRFSKCRLLLLHASYPFSKEASYLASVYSQVCLDFRLAVPKLSVHGMISSVKELLELAPIKKVMFSTDGYAFPETFYLSAKRAREVVFSVLRDACIDGDLSIPEAIEAAKDIFSENAKKFFLNFH
ncbi:Protein fluG [Camellia lanceoleosa]|uniref:Protein fluG n=1 Tax=Camellia lanceoleosa TaxID=1840588 RepID=A0ACC0IAA1_9ERIC|nr:Protein fluG [Camellia lanceoleosa]